MAKRNYRTVLFAVGAIMLATTPVYAQLPDPPTFPNYYSSPNGLPPLIYNTPWAPQNQGYQQQQQPQYYNFQAPPLPAVPHTPNCLWCR